VLVLRRPPAINGVTGARFGRQRVCLLGEVNEGDVVVHVLTPCPDVRGRMGARRGSALEPPDQPRAHRVGDQTHEGIDVSGLQRLVGEWNGRTEVPSRGLEARVGRTLPLAVDAHQGLEEEPVREVGGRGTELSDLLRVVEHPADLVFVLLADPDEHEVHVVLSQGFAGSHDDRAVQTVTMGERGARLRNQPPGDEQGGCLGGDVAHVHDLLPRPQGLA